MLDSLPPGLRGRSRHTDPRDRGREERAATRARRGSVRGGAEGTTTRVARRAGQASRLELRNAAAERAFFWFLRSCTRASAVSMATPHVG